MYCKIFKWYALLLLLLLLLLFHVWPRRPTFCAIELKMWRSGEDGNARGGVMVLLHIYCICREKEKDGWHCIQVLGSWSYCWSSPSSPYMLTLLLATGALKKITGNQISNSKIRSSVALLKKDKLVLLYHIQYICLLIFFLCMKLNLMQRERRI